MTYIATYNGLEDETPESWLCEESYLTKLLVAGNDGFNEEEARELLGRNWNKLHLNDGMDAIEFEHIGY